MNVKTLNISLQNLLDKLFIAEEIYKKAADRVHNVPMTDQFNQIAQQKANFLTELEAELGLESGEVSINFKDKIQVVLDKVGIEVNHIILNRNERALLTFCIKRDEELVKMYDDIMKSDLIDDNIQQLVARQKKETAQVISELTKTREAYQF